MRRHFNRQLGTGLLCLILALATATTRASEPEVIYLRTGQQYSGISRGIDQGVLRWELPHGDVISIPIDDIDRIELPVPIAALPATEAVPASSEEAASPPGAPEAITTPSAAGVPSAALATETVHEMGRFEAGFGSVGEKIDRIFAECDTWTKRIEFGGRWLIGNSDEQFVNVGYKMEKKLPQRFTQIEGGGQYGKSDGNVTSDRWFTNGTIDWNKETNEKWIWFATSKNEYDDFENLAYRGSLSTGLGYRFYNEPTKRLVTRIGPGVTYEQFNDPVVHRVTPDLFGEIESLWPLFDRTSFEHKTSLYPSLEDMEVFRFISTYGILIGLDDTEHWTLKLGLRHEYNSRPNVNREKSDITATFLLVYTRN